MRIDCQMFSAENCIRKLCPRFFLLVCIVFSTTVISAQTSFTFNQIPFSDPDFVAPGRGAEEWMVMNQVNIPVEGVNTQPLDAYYRFEWTQIEKSKGVYDWTAVDAAFKRALDKGQKFSFGIMPLCSTCTGTPVGGAKVTYPEYLHNEMQTEANKDWVYNGVWIPNWNSNYFLTAWENMLKAVAAHINNTSINGIRLSSIINYIDIRGYGNWGEWHNYPYGNNEPTANKANATSLLRLINAHKNAFPDIRLVALSDAFDTGNWSDVPPEAGYYLLTASNNAGQFGWRRDNWGDPASWYRAKLENNITTYNGQTFGPLIMNKWKYAPIVGEPSSCCTINGGSCQYWELEDQIRRYHTLSFGNGNLESPSSTCVRTNVRNASKASGYRLVVTDGSMTTSLNSGSQFTINLKWQNLGVTPTYEKWNVIYQLRNSSNQVVWSGTSSFKPQMFLPLASATLVQDNFTLPVNVPAGTYNMVMLVTDPANYRKPLPLAIKGRNTDGSYLIRSVNVTAQSTLAANKLPVANAGTDKSITLPTNSLQLDGRASSDSDGTIVKYRWSQVGGPGTASFTDYSAATATAQDLLQGVYSFRLTVTDDRNDSSYDDVSVTVQAAATTTVTPPLAATISGSTSVKCNGGSDGSATVSVTGGTAPYTYSWNTPTAQTTATAAGLATGTYTVKVTDSKAATTSASVTISQPAALDLIVKADSITTYGGSTTVSLSASGGTAPYSFTGATTVKAGTYTYSVTDANRCTKSKTYTFGQPAPVIVTIAPLTASISSTTEPSCNGSNNGSATVFVSGGVGPYTYTWNTSPVQTTATASGLAAGTYTVKVTDSKAATTSASVTIAQPAALDLIVKADSITTYGGSTTVTLNATGGTAPYSFTGATTVKAGTYTYSVTDANGCTKSKNYSFGQPAQVIVTVAPLTAFISSTSEPNCYGSNNGTATVSVSGGVGPYTYTWNTSPVQTGATAYNLTAGSYTVIVKDAEQRSASAQVTLNQPPPLTITATPGVITKYGGTTSVTLSATGGVPPYSFTGPVTNVYAGTYTYTVKDSRGCMASTTITITEPKPTGKFKKYNLRSSTSLSSPTHPTNHSTVEVTSLKTYPNPATSSITVSMENSNIGKGTITVISINAVVMSTMSFEKSGRSFMTTLDISSLAKGSYIIKIVFENQESLISKFIKL